jgi:hypothetical protein
MTPGIDSGTRVVESGVAIRAYINKGAVRRKPDQRADYVDYRRVRKPAKLFGHNTRQTPAITRSSRLHSLRGCGGAVLQGSITQKS